ncbi:hypothetical protein ACPZ19_16865 [Amycolatopsis lurida]
MTDTDKAPGWDAIDLALTAWYPGIKPRHVGSPIPTTTPNGRDGASN